MPFRVPRIRECRGDEATIPLRSSTRRCMAYRAVNDLLLSRAAVWHLAAATTRPPPMRSRRAIGLTGSTVSRALRVRRAWRNSASSRSGTCPVTTCWPWAWTGRRSPTATKVIALGITLAEGYRKRFLGFVETDTENERVMTLFLRSLVERGLDRSQGMLVILDGGKGLRAAVRKAFRHRALVPRCQWHKRENVVSHLAKNEQAAWRQRLQRAYNRPNYDDALGAHETLLGQLDEREPVGEPAAWPSSSTRPSITASTRGASACMGRSFKTTGLSGFCQCPGRGTIRQGRSLADLEPTAPMAGDGAPGHRTPSAAGDGLPAPDQAA